MADLRKATADDFGLVRELLASIGGARIEENTWRQLFVDHWNTGENYFGYVLLDGGEAVGFLGMMFSRRDFGSLNVKVCNLTSWVVKAGYRTESLKLLAPIAQMRDYLFTNFTAQKKVSFILKKFGFTEIDRYWVIIPPIVAIPAPAARRRFITDAREIERTISGKDLQIFRDHVKLRCEHAVITAGDTYCYIVFNRVNKKRIPFAQIDYISDIEVFHQNLAYMRNRIVFHAKAAAILIDERFLHNKLPRMSFRYRMPEPSPRLCRTDLDIAPAFIDNMYSELVVLGM